jgi:hypothetical protein
MRIIRGTGVPPVFLIKKSRAGRAGRPCHNKFSSSVRTVFSLKRQLSAMRTLHESRKVIEFAPSFEHAANRENASGEFNRGRANVALASPWVLLVASRFRDSVMMVVIES